MRGLTRAPGAPGQGCAAAGVCSRRHAREPRAQDEDEEQYFSRDDDDEASSGPDGKSPRAAGVGPGEAGTADGDVPSPRGPGVMGKRSALLVDDDLPLPGQRSRRRRRVDTDSSAANGDRDPDVENGDDDEDDDDDGIAMLMRGPSALRRGRPLAAQRGGAILGRGGAGNATGLARPATPIRFLRSGVQPPTGTVSSGLTALSQYAADADAADGDGSGASLSSATPP